MCATRTALWRRLLIGGVILAVLSLPMPRTAGIHAVLVIAFAGVAVAAIVAGLATHRPARRTPWILLAAGVTLYATGSVLWGGSPDGWTSRLHPSTLDAAYLIAYVSIFAALIAFAPLRRTNAGPTIDAFLITAGLAALSWLLLIHPYVRDTALSPFAKAASIAYPMLVLLVLAAAIRLAFVSARSPALWLLGGFVALRLIGDVAFGVATLAGSYRLGETFSALWLASSAFLAAAALHPSMATAEEAPDASQAARERRRLPVVVLAGPLPLAALLASVGRSQLHEFLAFVLVASATYLLIVGRVLLLRRDVAEQRTQAETLAAATERLRTMVEQIPGVVYATPADDGGQMSYISPRIEELLGYPAERWGSGGFWGTVIHPDDRDRVLAEDERTSESGALFRIDYRFVAADGRTVWVHDEAALVKDPLGTPPFWLGLIFDITGQKAAEQELLAAEDLYRSLVESAPGVTYRDVVDPGQPGGHRTEYISPQILELLGYSPEELVDDPRLWASLIHPEDRVGAQRADARHYATGEPLSHEIRMITREGRVRWVQDRAALIRRGGEIVSQGTLIDITQSRQLEEAIRAREAAEEANRAKTEFLSRASHELRTPLNAILGFGQLLEQASLPPEDHESAEEVVEAGRRLLGIVDDVLGIARLEVGRVSLSIEPVRLAELAQEAVAAVLPSASMAGVAVDSGGEPDEDPYVMADRESLRKALVHLVHNAVHYNRSGGVAALRWRRVEAELVQILVQDDGPGLTEDEQARLFSPFERLGAERSEVPGTGLGLALTKRLIEGMGGTISVTSRPGSGTTFSIRLLEAAAPDADPPSLTPDGPAGIRRTVLYIEDNPSSVGLVERTLSRRPLVRLLTAQAGALGFRLAEQHHPDLILLDLNLPDLPGEEVLGRLFADPSTADIPIVVLSADTTASKAQRLLRAGAREYLVKPLDVRRLLEVVDDVLPTPMGADRGA